MRFDRGCAFSMLLFMLTSSACILDRSPRTSEGPPPSLPYSARPPPTALPRPSSSYRAQRIIPTSNKIVLPEGVQLSDIRVAGRDLVVTLPDSTQTIIRDGAVFVPQLVIGNVEFPAGNLYALLIGPEPRPGAGPSKPRVRNVSTRLFVPARFSDFEVYGAVAIIAFPQVPATIAESNRHRRICEAYLTTLPDAIITRKLAPDLRQMVTVWPRSDITEPVSAKVATPGATAAKCRRAVDNYDHVTAAVWLSLVPKRAGLERTGRGPFLVAWAPSSAIGNPRSAVLVFDLSDFEQISAIQKAFRIWKVEIENDPRLWHKGWNMTRWKAHTAARLDRYGKRISSALTMVPWLKG
jgi:hypothetical protein